MKPGDHITPKPLLYQVAAELHALHFTDAVIAKLTGFTPRYIRHVLDQQGLRQRWFKADCASEALPPQLRRAIECIRKCN